MNKQPVTTCDACGWEGAQVKHITRSYGKRSRLLVVEDIPAVRCLHCGESYMTAETLREIERIKLHRRDLAVARQVPVAEYA